MAIKYIPFDKSWIIRMGILDMVNGYSDTIPSDILRKQFLTSYVVTINELFRERLAQRFANYLSRFGLPVLNNPVPAE